ncbi:MAG: hypothetical protein CMM50_09320 [Rhodospirillaceae bacterium]|nr:hypothetical protein [Rhodospirillaceae bacterium]|tara:strand:+ start:230 stop:682 length:453 start_codon:yes stop_codon:yes gene_type:complete
MILFDLKCKANHVFEAWFRDGAAYEHQAEAGEIACPLCGDRTIVKAPMAPRLSTGASEDVPSGEPQSGEGASAEAADLGKAMKLLRKLREDIERSSDYVGNQFPEEARKIHYGEVEERRIYGEASKEEARELREEGIDVVSVPWLSRTDS